jgi:protein-S-isoprenylcysteine O-methyltransferase Ste14
VKVSDGQARRRREEERDDLTGEHALTDIGQLVLALLFAGTWIADSFFLHVTTFLNGTIHPAIRVPIAAVLLGLSGYLAWSSHRFIFGETRREPHVVRDGVFSVVRHPMYLSEILLYLGLLLLSVSLIAAGVWLAAIGFLHAIARSEERLLAARFGDEYAAYARDVGMWLPRLRKR